MGYIHFACFSCVSIRNVGAAYLQINGRCKFAQVFIFSKLVKFVTLVSVLRFFFYTEACDELLFASCWSCRTAMAHSA